jgi:hypothetical protein
MKNLEGKTRLKVAGDCQNVRENVTICGHPINGGGLTRLPSLVRLAASVARQKGFPNGQNS